MLSLFDVLSNDERIIVYSDRVNDTIYTWNQSLTLQAWAVGPEGCEEVSIRTLTDKPRGYRKARLAAQAWALDMLGENE